jgi:hypothetical protein
MQEKRTLLATWGKITDFSNGNLAERVDLFKRHDWGMKEISELTGAIKDSKKINEEQREALLTSFHSVLRAKQIAKQAKK